MAQVELTALEQKELIFIQENISKALELHQQAGSSNDNEIEEQRMVLQKITDLLSTAIIVEQHSADSDLDGLLDEYGGLAEIVTISKLHAKVKERLLVILREKEETEENETHLRKLIGAIQDFSARSDLREPKSKKAISDKNKIGLIIRALGDKGWDLTKDDLNKQYETFKTGGLEIKNFELEDDKSEDIDQDDSNPVAPQLKFATASLNKLIQENVGAVVEKLSKHVNYKGKKCPIRITFSDFDLSLKMALVPNKAFSGTLDGVTMVNALRSTVAFDPIAQRMKAAITGASLVKPIDFDIFKVVIKFDFIKADVFAFLKKLKEIITESKSVREAEEKASKLVSLFSSTFQVQFTQEHVAKLMEYFSAKDWSSICLFEKASITGSWKINLEVDYVNIIKAWFKEKLERLAKNKLEKQLRKEAEEFAKKGYSIKDLDYDELKKHPNDLKKLNQLDDQMKGVFKEAKRIWEYIPDVKRNVVTVPEDLIKHIKSLGEKLKQFGEKFQELASNTAKKLAKKVFSKMMTKTVVKAALKFIPVVGQIVTAIECIQVGVAILRWAGILKPLKISKDIELVLLGTPTDDGCVNFRFRQATLKADIFAGLDDVYNKKTNVFKIPIAVNITVIVHGCNSDFLCRKYKDGAFAIQTKGNFIRNDQHIEGQLKAEEIFDTLKIWLEQHPVLLEMVKSK